MDRSSMEGSLLGSGRGSGLTIDSLIRLAERAAASSGISEDLAGRIAASYVRKGLPGHIIEDLVARTNTYAKISGQSIDMAVVDIAFAFDSPKLSVVSINKSLSMLDARSLRKIEDLEDSGKLGEAQYMLLGIFNAAVPIKL